MPKPKINNKAPIFKGPCTNNKEVNLSDLKGQNVVLYFYPKDSTPGCTTEGQDFRDLKSQFTKANTIIFGLSRESIKSHENFKAKEKFNFELISDPDEKICKKYDVIKEKSMYGRKYMGIERSTFLIDANGKLVQEWRKVKVTGHAKEVLEAAKELWNQSFIGSGQAFIIAFINVAKGMAKKSPQKPHIPPKNKTAIMIMTGWRLFLLENNRGTKTFPSSIWINK